MSVVTKTIRLSGESDDSFEEAISAAVGRAALTITDIVSYTVVELTGTVDDSGVPSFKATIDLTFNIKESIHG